MFQFMGIWQLCKTVHCNFWTGYILFNFSSNVLYFSCRCLEHFSLVYSNVDFFLITEMDMLKITYFLAVCYWYISVYLFVCVLVSFPLLWQNALEKQRRKDLFCLTVLQISAHSCLDPTVGLKWGRTAQWGAFGGAKLLASWWPGSREREEESTPACRGRG